MAADDYILGSDPAELRRLALQAEMLQPITERLLRRAGLAEGMRVLDLGCGPGDVSFMAAAIVGPSGGVVGVDRAVPAITAARLRAEREHVTNVEFRHETLSGYAVSERFDAAVGRYVLLHQADPTSFIRDARRHVRPGGVLAFHDISVRRHDCFSHPVVPAWQQACDWINMAFDPEGPGRDAALRLVEHFIDAGLQTPALFAEALIGGGPDSPLYAWVAETLRSVAPVLLAKRLASQADLGLDGLEDRLRSDVVRAKAQLQCWTQVCAWGTV